METLEMMRRGSFTQRVKGRKRSFLLPFVCPSGINHICGWRLNHHFLHTFTNHPHTLHGVISLCQIIVASNKKREEAPREINSRLCEFVTRFLCCVVPFISMYESFLAEWLKEIEMMSVFLGVWEWATGGEGVS